MRQALRPSTRGNRALTASISAPIGGLNTQDGLADMPPLDATIMDNTFPRTSDVMVRKGFSNYVTGITGKVETLMQYASGSTRALFAAAGTAIYDVTITGTVGAAVVTAQSNARWQYTNFGTAGGRFLLAVNGANTPLNYNGSIWATTPAITGVASATLIHVNPFKERLFFIENNTMNAWYLPVSSIGGAASRLDFSTLFKLGGHLMSMGTWTIDGGNGIDDYAVWITSEGEVAVYQGTDPSNSATWALVGVFRLGKPIGRRCMVKLGGDLAVITYDGIVPLSKALRNDRIDAEIALSNKIRSELSNLSIMHGNKYGWQIILFPSVNMLIVNVPTNENTTSVQYVMNTITGAWCRFTGIYSICFELFNEHIYFGTDGKVGKFWDTNADAGTMITADIKQAWSYFGRKGQLKKFNMARPVLSTDGVINPVMDMNVDFEDKVPSSAPTFSTLSTSAWNTSPWNTTPWTRSLGIQKSWQSVTGLGYAAALRMRASTNSPIIIWTSTDYIFEAAGYI